MPKLLLSAATVQALSEWNDHQAGRGFNYRSRPLAGGRFEIEIAAETAERIERIRLPGETDDALLLRLVQSLPGQGRVQ